MSRIRSGFALSIFILSIGATPAIAQSGSENTSLLNKGKYVPDIGTFMQIGANSPTGYSWDGKEVFFNSSMSGAPQVYRITKEGWPYQLTTFEDGLDFFKLSNDGMKAIVGASIGGSEQSQLYFMDTRTGRISPLTSGKEVQYGSVTWSPDNSHIYFRSNEENKTDFFIYKMDMTSGQYEKIFGDSAGWRGYFAISDISSDGTLMIVARFNSNADNELFLLNLN
ncbi:MAG: TolB family protein, partial [Candidatus Zixiibacteriota bacterium]